MRQVGNLAKESDARRFASYLVTKGISAQAESDSDDWTIWVRDENSIEQARQLFELFKIDPTSSEYRSAERAAELIQREQQTRLAQSQKNVVEMRGRWGQGVNRRAPLTVTLIILSILVTLTNGFGEAKEGLGAAVGNQLAFVDRPSYDAADDNPLAAISKGEVWRLVTPIFVHLSPIHLVFNMIWFFQFAMLIESRRGTSKLALLILFVAVLSNVAQAVLPSSLGGHPFFGGMSGVVYGLFGYVWVQSMVAPKSGFFVYQSTVIILLGWLLLCMTPVMPNVANAAHVVGLISGMASGFIPSLWKT